MMLTFQAAYRRLLFHTKTQKGCQKSLTDLFKKACQQSYVSLTLLGTRASNTIELSLSAAVPPETPIS